MNTDPPAAEREGPALPGRREPSAGEREGPAPRKQEPSAGEREGPAPRKQEPSAGEREGPAPRKRESQGTYPCTCPGCETRFRVTDAQLAVANGRVRCGACLTVFDCSDLVARPEPDEVAGAKLAGESLQPGSARGLPLASKSPQPGSARGEPLASKSPQPGSARGSPLAGNDPAIVPTKVPEAAPRTQHRSPVSATPVPVGLFATAYAASVLLLAALVLGLMFPAWSQQPTLRGVYRAACAIAPCEPAPLRALAAIAVKPLRAERRAGPPPTLAVPLELTNQAAFPQPFPDFAVRIVTSDDRELPGLRLTPEDYLTRGHSPKMTPNTPVTIELQLEDPGGDAARYMLSAL